MTGAGFSRRRLLESSGLAAAMGVVLAACGDRGGDTAPGRVGYAPPVTPLPTASADDPVFLRTATSMEELVRRLYGDVIGRGDLDADAQALMERFVEDHGAAVGTLAELTAQAGGEPYECANAWYTERVVPPILDAIDGDEAAGIEPSDDPGTDQLRVSYAFETMLAAMYQRFVELVTDPALRVEMMRVAAVASRHAAAVAMLVTGTPEAYVSPVVLGGELTPDESGRAELYAIAQRFGALSSTELVVGVPNAAGTRPSFPLETPADNSYVYEGMTCET